MKYRLCFSRRTAAVAWALLAAVSLATAQELDVASDLDLAPPLTESHTIQSLEALQRALALKEEELVSLQAQIRASVDDGTREDLNRRIGDLRKQIEDQRRQFEGFAVDIDLSPFGDQPKAKFDWQEEVGKLLEPIMAEVEAATAESRVIGQLREQIEEVGQRRDLASQAVANLEELLSQPASPELTARLQKRLEVWTRTRDEAANEYTALDIQLQSRLAARQSVLDQTTNYARHFVRTRGLNLLFGVGAFFVVFFGFRLTEFVVRKLRHKSSARSFGSRLTALLFHIFSILGGLLAMLVVFNLVGDWFMLGIVVIFLFGVGWAGIKTLPQHVETVKLMLNIGAVREGERVEVEGTPYGVDSIGFVAKLSNPLLDGGHLILPVKYLVGRHSRKLGEKEPWFPCREGDWVELSDGVSGRVAGQTPSLVTLVQLGGARVAYRTPDFLALHPRNLSSNFRIETTVGLDYRHQAIATTDVPAILTRKLEAGLAALVEPAHLLDVDVQLAQTGVSALVFAIAIDLAGEAAPRARDVRLALSALFVEACNENAWVIPFNQLTLHQAERRA